MSYARRHHEEHDQQAAFFKWAAMQKQYPLKWMFAIPNSARRSPQQGAWMKAEGMKKGVWDVFLPAPAGGYNGLWIEFKSGKNTLTPEQEAFKGDLINYNYQWCVCYSWTSAKLAVEVYFATREEVCH
jgi:hypothetical protein